MKPDLFQNLVCVIFTMLMLALSHAVPAHAGFVLKSNYEFDGTLMDTLGNGADLVPVGAPAIGAGQSSFGENDGFQLDTSVTSRTYRLEFDISFDQINTWNKLIDFQDRTVDEGLYIGPNGTLEFYSDIGIGSSVLATGQTYTIGIQKTGNVVIVDLDGVQQFRFSPSGPATSEFDRIVFFADDFEVPDEGSIGTVSSIRIYTIPEPSSSALIVSLSVVSLALRRRNVRHNHLWNHRMQ